MSVIQIPTVLSNTELFCLDLEWFSIRIAGIAIAVVLTIPKPYQYIGIQDGGHFSRVWNEWTYDLE